MLDTLAKHGDGGDNGKSEQRRHPLMVDHDATRDGLVEHVQRQHQRHAHLCKLDGQQQRPAGVLGIADLHDRTQRAIEQDAGGHLLVFGARGQRDDPRRVDHHGPRDGQGRALQELNRSAGIVRDGSVAAGQPLEERRLPDVRMPNQRNGAPGEWCEWRSSVASLHYLSPVQLMSAAQAALSSGGGASRQCVHETYSTRGALCYGCVLTTTMKRTATITVQFGSPSWRCGFFPSRYQTALFNNQ
jgi:hypothetical protein